MKISELKKKIEGEKEASSSSPPPLVKRESERPEDDVLDPIDIRRLPPSHWKPNLGCGKNYMD